MEQIEDKKISSTCSIMEHTLNRKAAFQGGCDLGGLKELLFLSDCFSCSQDNGVFSSFTSMQR